MSEEEGGHGVGLWYVSFSDMITLLLSFFVMLATFSSYSKEGINKFAGTCAAIANYSILPGKGLREDSVASKDVTEWGTEGSENPTGEPRRTMQKAKRYVWQGDTDGAYWNRRIFYIPSRTMFWGRGTSLTPEGMDKLDLIAFFMQRVPCNRIISEVGRGVEEPSAAERALDRSWAIASYLIDSKSLAPGRFNVSATNTPLPPSVVDSQVVQILLVTRSISQ